MMSRLCLWSGRRWRCGSRTRLDRADQDRITQVGDVEDMQALEPFRDRLAVAGHSGRGRRVPGADQDVPPDDDVALVAEALLEHDLAGPGGPGDVQDPEPVVVGLERQV